MSFNVAGQRQSGKTTWAIKLAAKNFSTIVCSSQKAAENIHLQAMKMKLDIPFPITFSEFLRNQWYASGIKGFVFDDIDLMVGQLCNVVPVHGITMTGTYTVRTETGQDGGYKFEK